MTTSGSAVGAGRGVVVALVAGATLAEPRAEVAADAATIGDASVVASMTLSGNAIRLTT